MKRIIRQITAVVSMLGIAAPALAAAPNPTYSIVSTDKTDARADGIEQITVSVIVKDDNLIQLEGVPVTLTSSRGAMDEITPEIPTTNLVGKARFLVRSLRNGTSTLTAVAQGVTLSPSPTVTFSHGLSVPVLAGDLIKIPDDGDVQTLNDTAVYYYAVDGRRYVFPNEKVYYTWYDDFSRVKIIPLDQMSLVPIGGNVTYHPGSKLAKFQTDPKTYLVTRGGVLRWVTTEQVARGLFGPNWNQFVDDITEAFYVNYRFGVPVENSLDVALDIIRAGTHTIDDDKGLINRQFP